MWELRKVLSILELRIILLQKADKLNPVIDFQLLEKIIDVVLDRVLRNEKLLRDLCIIKPFVDIFHDFFFSGRQIVFGSDVVSGEAF